MDCSSRPIFVVVISKRGRTIIYVSCNGLSYYCIMCFVTGTIIGYMA